MNFEGIFYVLLYYALVVASGKILFVFQILFESSYVTASATDGVLRRFKILIRLPEGWKRIYGQTVSLTLQRVLNLLFQVNNIEVVQG